MEHIIETGDRGKRFLRRKTNLEQLGLSEVQKQAGEEFAKLWELCRKYWSDAPPIEPKTQNFLPSLGHDPEVTDEKEISFGVECHKRYQSAIRCLAAEPEGRNLIKAVLSICVENKTPTSSGRDNCVRGLRLLVQHFGY